MNSKTKLISKSDELLVQLRKSLLAIILIYDLCSMLFHSAILSLTHFSHSAFKTMVDPGHRDYSYTVTHHTI